jgi:Flp pilus assembly protein TadD
MMAILALCAATAAGGVIVTKDGTRVEGDLKKSPDGWDVVGPGGKITSVKTADVQAILLSNDSSPGMDGLYSLRRSVENLDDFPKILERYKRFIDQANDPAVIEEARRDVATWKQRQRDDMVRVGRKWVTRVEQHRQQLEAFALIDTARAQIRAGDLAAAGKTTQQMLALDPQNVSAFYLQGVIAMRGNKPAEARKAFDAARAIVGDHAPTLYNISVLHARMKQWPAAVTTLHASLGAAPNVRELLDAAAELLQLVPDARDPGPATKALAARFAEQDAVLAKEMEAKQMYRWGATWVDKAAYDKLAEADKTAKEKIDKMQSDFELTQNRVNAIETQTKENEATLREIELRSFTRTADGTTIRLPLPQAYYELKNANAALVAERKEMLARLDALRNAAKRAVNDFPVPKYAGVLTPIDEDGVPVILPPGMEPPGPASRPATQPAPPPVIRIGPGPGAVESAE